MSRSPSHAPVTQPTENDHITAPTPAPDAVGQSSPAAPAAPPQVGRGPGESGVPTPSAAPAPEATSGAAPAASVRRRRLVLVVPILVVVGVIAAILGERYWYESTYFVGTDNAQVMGDLVQVGSFNAGQIVATRVDVGDHVSKGQELAVVAIPQQVGATAFGNAKLAETGTEDAQASVRSPLNGVVAARTAYPGGTVSAGQSMFMVVDPERVWVKANIEETKIARVHPGQPVEVHSDALDRTFPGWVESITPASAATFSLLPAQNASGNFTKVTQLVPVRIGVRTDDVLLPLGTSVEVRIQVQDPEGGVPWRP